MGEYIKAKKITINYEIDFSLLIPKLVMDLKIGTNSPVLNLLYDGEIKHKLSLWDEWCHFKRKHYKTFKLDKNKKILEIEISNQHPNYAECRNKEFDFSKFVNHDKYIYLRNVFIVGGKFKEIEFA